MPETGQDRVFWHLVCDIPLCELTAHSFKTRNSAGWGAVWYGGQWPGHGTGWPWTTRGQGTSCPLWEGDHSPFSYGPGARASEYEQGSEP